MLFETDVVVWALRGHAGAARGLDLSAERKISIVSFMELIQGARSKSEMRHIQKSLRNPRFQGLPLSEAIGAKAAAIMESYSL